MDYEYLWKALEALALDLRSKGKDVTQDVIDDLKAAKTLMSIQRVDPSSPVASDVEEYLRKVEAALLSNAEYDVGSEYADQWLSRLEEAKKKGAHEIPQRRAGFVAGVPKGNDWVKVTVTELVDMRELEKMASGLDLSNRRESEDTVRVYGQPEKVKAFIRQLAEKTKRK